MFLHSTYISLPRRTPEMVPKRFPKSLVCMINEEPGQICSWGHLGLGLGQVEDWVFFFATVTARVT